MTTYKWIGYGKENLKVYTYKKNIPSQPGIGIVPIRIDFGLHGYAYALAHGDKLRLKNGEWAGVFKAHLVSFGKVIGPHDAEAARNHPCAEEWRGAFHQRNLERLQLA